MNNNIICYEKTAEDILNKIYSVCEKYHEDFVAVNIDKFTVTGIFLILGARYLNLDFKGKLSKYIEALEKFPDNKSNELIDKFNYLSFDFS